MIRHVLLFHDIAENGRGQAVQHARIRSYEDGTAIREESFYSVFDIAVPDAAVIPALQSGHFKNRQGDPFVGDVLDRRSPEGAALVVDVEEIEAAHAAKGVSP